MAYGTRKTVWRFFFLCTSVAAQDTTRSFEPRLLRSSRGRVFMNASCNVCSVARSQTQHADVVTYSNARALAAMFVVYDVRTPETSARARTRFSTCDIIKPQRECTELKSVCWVSNKNRKAKTDSERLTIDPQFDDST